jgi:hypothetical protein
LVNGQEPFVKILFSAPARPSQHERSMSHHSRLHRRNIGLLLAVPAIAWCVAAAAAQGGAAIPFPDEFRTWAHVKSVLVGPESRAFATEGGIHHIYANPKAVQGYRSGTFPDGAVVVYNLLETKQVDGNTVEGATRRVDVMVKDGQRYRQTGGWGFARFIGDNRSENTLSAEHAAACATCHGQRKDRDSIFSEFRK